MKHQMNSTERHSIKHLTTTLQKCQGHKSQGKIEKISYVGGNNGDMTTNKYSAPSWVELWTQEGHSLKTREL